MILGEVLDLVGVSARRRTRPRAKTELIARVQYVVVQVEELTKAIADAFTVVREDTGCCL